MLSLPVAPRPLSVQRNDACPCFPSGPKLSRQRGDGIPSARVGGAPKGIRERLFDDVDVVGQRMGQGWASVIGRVTRGVGNSRIPIRHVACGVGARFRNPRLFQLSYGRLVFLSVLGFLAFGARLFRQAGRLSTTVLSMPNRRKGMSPFSSNSTPSASSRARWKSACLAPRRDARTACRQAPQLLRKSLRSRAEWRARRRRSRSRAGRSRRALALAVVRVIDVTAP